MHSIIEEVLKRVSKEPSADLLINGFPTGAKITYLANGVQVDNLKQDTPPYLRFIDNGKSYQVLSSADKANWQELTGEEAEALQLYLLYIDPRVSLPFVSLTFVRGDQDGEMLVEGEYDVSQTNVSPMVKEELQEQKTTKLKVSITIEAGRVVEISHERGADRVSVAY